MGPRFAFAVINFLFESQICACCWGWIERRWVQFSLFLENIFCRVGVCNLPRCVPAYPGSLRLFPPGMTFSCFEVTKSTLRLNHCTRIHILHRIIKGRLSIPLPSGCQTQQACSRSFVVQFYKYKASQSSVIGFNISGDFGVASTHGITEIVTGWCYTERSIPASLCTFLLSLP